MFRLLMDSLLAKDLGAALDAGEALASLKSREKMKAFCRFAGDALREVFLLQQGLKDLSAVDNDYLRELASKCRRTFPRKASEVLDRANMLIDRNVNQKILFCDMVNRMFLMI